MAATERRTLEIIAKVTDLASRPFRTMGSELRRFTTEGVRQFGAMVRSAVSIRGAIAAVAAGFAAFKAGSAFSGIVDANAEVARLARGSGAAADDLLTLKDAFGLVDLEGTKFRTLVNGLNKVVGQALRDSASGTAKGFRDLGISLDDLSQGNPVKLFDKLATSLERFATPQERAGALLKAFPEAASDLDVLIDALGRGDQAFQQLLTTARFFGGTIGGEGFAAIERMAGAMNLLRLSIDGVSRSAVARLSQTFGPIVEKLATFLAANRDTIANGFAKVAEVVSKAVLLITAAFLRLVAFLSANGSAIVESLEEIPLVGEKVAAALRSIFQIPNLDKDARDIRDTMASVARDVVAFDREIEALGSSADTPDGFVRGKRLERLRADREAQFRELQRLDAQFQDAGGGLGGAQAQLDAARVGDFADLVKGAASFDDLPSPPTGTAPMMRALFGASGVEAAESKVASFSAGISGGLERVKRQWTDFGAAGADAVGRIAGGGLDQLADGISNVILRLQSAREAFREFARFLITEIVKITVRLALMAAIMAITGLGAPVAAAGAGAAAANAAPAAEYGMLANRGVVGTVPARRFERGGIVREPTIALFGEGSASRGEAFVPLPDGRRIPVDMRGGGGGGTVHVTIHAMDGADVARVLWEQRDLLGAIWGEHASRSMSVRHTIRGHV